MTAWALAAVVLSAAPPLGLRLDAGAGVPVSARASGTFGLGLSGALTAELEVLEVLGLDLQVGYTRLERLATAPVPGTAGTVLSIGAGVRTHTPLDGKRVIPWLDAIISWGYSGGHRMVLSAAAGVSARPFDRAFFLVGAFARLQQVLNPAPSGVHTTILSFGVSLELRQPHEGVAEQVAGADEKTVLSPTEPPSNVERVESVISAGDTDGDGIPDDVDRCLGEKEDKDGIADQDGCPETDGDTDGVDDKVDACPTIAGRSTNKGCPNYPKVVVRDDRLDLKEKITFANDSARFTGDSTSMLDEVAKVLVDRPGLCLLITAHTDNTGSEDANLSLSGNQAQAVRAYLVKKGISVDRLSTRGFGEQKPLNRNRNANEREQNRRVEILVNPCAEPL